MISDEKARIENIVRPLASAALQPPPRVDGASVSLLVDAADGDDCAVVEISGHAELVLTTDYVRGTKFRLYELGHLSLFDLGYYLAIANLSDVASMGAAPLGLLPVIRYPKDLDDASFSECMNGIVDAARTHGTSCIGGDIGTAERLILSASAIGICEAGRSLKRSGASPGDLVFVSGPIGRAGAAVLYFSAVATGQVGPISEASREDLLSAWRRPRARFDIARTLAATKTATACQDVSDGLKATVEELGSASSVGLELDEAALPIPLSVREVADALGVGAVPLALSASVDFELVFCIDSSASREFVTQLEKSGAMQIGRCVEGVGARLSDGTRTTHLPGVTWRHQSDQIELTILNGLRE